MAGRLPVVVALGSVDPGLVTGVLDGHCRFVPSPGDAELSLAAAASRRPSPTQPGAPTGRRRSIHDQLR